MSVKVLAPKRDARRDIELEKIVNCTSLILVVKIKSRGNWLLLSLELLLSNQIQSGFGQVILSQESLSPYKVRSYGVTL